MPHYIYRCKDMQGKTHKGKMFGATKGDVLQQFKRNNWVVVSLREETASIWKSQIYIGNPVKNKDFVVFCRQFATLIQAGVSIVDSTRILSEQSESKPLKQALGDMLTRLRQGYAFSEAASDHPRIFPSIFINMVHAGEESGSLDTSLERLATYFEKEHQTREKVKSALTYPVVVGLIALITVAFLLKFVVPRFVSMFDQMDAELPLITTVVLKISASVENQWWLWLLAILLILISYQWFKSLEQGKHILDFVKLKMPVFGILTHKGAIAQMTRTLSSLYASSVPLLKALFIVEKVVDNRVIGKYLEASREALRRGMPLSEPLKHTWVFPPLVSQMIAIGEETGTLDSMLDKIADFYEQEVEHQADKLKALIEPIMIVLLAGIVGFIVAAILLPMLSIYQQI